MIQDPSTAFADHLDWLHRWFVAREVDVSAADDLVQLTLIEAWRNLGKLQHVEGMQPWLRAIANHVLHRWWRNTAREARLLQAPKTDADRLDDMPDDRCGEPSAGIEHDELAALVAYGLDQLPDTTRTLLKARYHDDLSVADLAVRSRITPAYMAVRLQRARAQLRTVLLQADGHDLATYGFDLAAITWRSTRLWCPSCGMARLSMELDPKAGVFALKCSQCATGPDAYLYNWRLVDALPYENPLGSARTAANALDRTLGVSIWNVPELGQARHCPRCQRYLTCHATLPAGMCDELGNVQMEMCCPACGPLSASATFGGMAAFHPQGVAFWRNQQRIRTRPPHRTVFEQTDAIQVDLVSGPSTHSLSFVFSSSGERLLGIIPDA